MKLDSLGYFVYATFECSGLDNKWVDIDPLRIQYKKSGAPIKHVKAYPPNNPIRFFADCEYIMNYLMNLQFV